MAYLLVCKEARENLDLTDFKKDLFKKILQIPIAKLGKCFPFRDGFYAFFGSFGGDIFWNYQISIGLVVSTFPL